MLSSESTKALSKPDVGESQQIQLTSPLMHIGSVVSRLNPFEYVQTAKRVYLPNQEALAKGLWQRGRLQDFIGAIESQSDITQILEQAFGSEWQNARDPDGNAIFPKATSSQKWTDSRITDLRPMIRNGFGQLYIPGSSIKGAIRTAIAYHLLKHADRHQVPKTERVSEIERTLRDRLAQGKVKPQQKFFDDDLFMDRLFADFSLHYQGKTIAPKSKQNTDFMRAIRVSDTHPLIEHQRVDRQGKSRPFNIPIVAEVIVSSYYPNYQAKYRAPIYAEMVRHVSTGFTLSLDTEMLSWFQHQQGMQIPFRSIADILKICQEFAQDQWDGEHDYWQSIKNNRDQERNLDFSYIREIYEPETCPYSLRLGWGSGMNGVTIDLLLKEELKSEIRDTCGIKAPQFEAPKSRRTIASPQGDIRFVPGWVKFRAKQS
jgi:CRISPR-associated protein Csm5